MMQSEIFLPSWPNSNITFSNLNHNMAFNLDETDLFMIDDLDFSCSLESSMISSNSNDPAMFLDKFLNLENSCNEIQVSSSVGELEMISSGEIEEIFEWINDNETEENSSSPLTMESDDWSPSLSLDSNENTTQDMSLVFPGDETKVDNQLRLPHLLMAYAEATENEETELADEIVKSVNEISNPKGETMERVAYNLFQSRDDRGKYIRQQSMNNLITAFPVFYQGLPNGKFAHFAANSAILESVPIDLDKVHIIDFDMGEGIQWPPVIEALSMRRKTVRLTSITSKDKCGSLCWHFEETKKRLENHAGQFGVKLIVEEKGTEDFVSELVNIKTSEQSREWLVFNCMVGLPHMGQRRSRNRVTEFLKVANDSLATFAGITILGDGKAGGKADVCSSYSSFFEKLLRHYRSLFESLERNLPSHLAEARVALESLFLAPPMCPDAWLQEWEETRNSCSVQPKTGMKSRRFSQESLVEAKQVVNERENGFTVGVDGLNGHEMVLLWKETPVVRVSVWS